MNEWKEPPEPEDPPAKSKPSGPNEHARAGHLSTKIPPVLVWEKEWYVYKFGIWKKTSREIYLRDALETMPPTGFRSIKKARDTLDHFAGMCQLKEDMLKSAYCFDGDDILLNCSNGVLRISCKNKTAILEDHDPKWYFTTQLLAAWDDTAECPLFTRTVEECLPDKEDQDLLWTFAATILLPSSEHEKALCNFGPGGTGKSTVVIGLAAVLGKDNCMAISMAELCSKLGYYVPLLKNVMLNVSTELDAVLVENAENIKRLISGETLTCREIRGRPQDMTTTCKLIFNANNLPRFKGGTDAEMRRMRFLRFQQVPLQTDITLKDRLPLERDGILRGMVEKLLTLSTLKEFPLGGTTSRLTRGRFGDTNDLIGSFLLHHCEIIPNAHEDKEALKTAFSLHLEDLGYTQEILSEIFFRRLYDLNPDIRPGRVTNKNGNRIYVVKGIKLKPESFTRTKGLNSSDFSQKGML
jgi:P4 family phage/plasmid primase-like protien